MQDFFILQGNNTALAHEMPACPAVYLGMDYTLPVNTAILSASGIPDGAVFVLMALTSIFGICLMAS